MKLIPPDASYAILIRHAERHITEKATDFGNQVRITERGVIKSREFGRNPLIKKIDHIYSSPILRCIQTAEAIMSAAGIRDSNIITKRSLGDPGSYIQDTSRAGKHFLESDSREVIKSYISSGRLDGFYSLPDGSKNLLNDLLHDFWQGQSHNLYVSHDAVVMPFISYYSGEIFRDYWLDFLDGVIIMLIDGKVKMIWNESEYAIDGA